MTAAAWSLGVLAGGRSSRMGTDKAGCPFGGGTLLSHAIARYGVPGAPVLVSTRGGPPPAAHEGVVQVPDAEPELGPLAGIAALLARASAPWLLILPVDLPLFPGDCGRVLAARTEGHDAVVFSSKGRVEPFPALVSRDLGGLVNDLLRRGLRRADSFHGEARTRVVPFEEAYPGRDAATAWRNVNAPPDLAAAERLIASEPR